MAPRTADEDFAFIMTCIKHSPPTSKPDFDKVAKEIGAKNANACYHRHWSIMKKWGMAGGGVGRARRAGDTVIGGGTGTPRKPRTGAGAGGTKRKAGEMPDAATTSENGLDSVADDMEEESVIKKAKSGKKAAPKGIKAEPGDDEVDSEQVIIKNEHADGEQSVAGDGDVETGV